MKLSAVDKAIASLNEQIGEHQREIAALEAAIKALKQEQPKRKPRALKMQEAAS